MGFRILCMGDVHLGRRPARLPAGLSCQTAGPRQAWNAFVNRALELKVGAVVLTGDVVDESNRFYEAFTILHSGVAKLVEAGVPIFAVSGNHDYDILPRLADEIQDFRLLGRGGQWEEAVLQSDSGPTLRFQGWSFPSRHVTTSPLADYLPPDDGVPTVGLLHCDCGAPASSYGPVSLAELKAKAPDIWLLGHIHVPGLLARGGPTILYPGSPQGLDPSEQGPHGAWMVDMEPGQVPSVELLPLAELRWERVDLSLEQAADEQSLQQAAVGALQRKHEAIRGQLGLTKAVCCRLCLSGRTSLHRQLPSLAGNIQADLNPTFEGVEYFIERVEDLTRPEISLEDLARSSDPTGLLASRLLLLEQKQPVDDYHELISRAREAIESHPCAAVFASLPAGMEPLSDDQVESALLRAGLHALDQLVAQKESRE